jgi:hypothetical protein
MSPQERRIDQSLTVPWSLLPMTRPYELTYPASGPAALPAPAAGVSAAQPWGFWGTLGWLILAATAGLMASLGVVIVWLVVKTALPTK